MNLQPLFDLKERLSHAAIAGTALLQEDFRLHRAVEALAPLAAANPVFGKIAAAAKALLSCPEAERSSRLLDVLSLVDAVVYTQGVSNVPGDLIPLPGGSGSYAQAPYSELQPLMTALSGTGSGRTTLIRDMWQSHPAYFRDFRVLPLVVDALSDSYSELADMVGEILMQLGRDVIPLLKDGFDPDGKPGMARRVRIIARLSRDEENTWFRSVLPDTKKEVRIAVIQALGNCSDNAQLLLELCQTEKGKAKEAALHAAARMEDPEIEALLRKELKKKPALLHCLTGVDTFLASDLAAGEADALVEELLSGPTYNTSQFSRIHELRSVLSGKYSPACRDFWLRTAKRMPDLAKVTPEGSSLGDYTAAEHFQAAVLESILCCSPEMLFLARELAALDPERLLCCAVLADLAEHSAETVYEKYSPCFVQTGLLRRETAAERNRRLQVLQAFTHINWSEGLDSYIISFRRFDPLTGEEKRSVWKLDGFDPRWVSLLCSDKTQMDGQMLILSTRSGRCAPEILLLNLIHPGDDRVCGPIGKYLYQKMRKSGDLFHYFRDLCRCGWTDWEGMLLRCLKEADQVRYDLVLKYLNLVPMTNRQKAKELLEADAFVSKNSIKIWMNLWPSDQIRLIAARLEADPNADVLKTL